MDCLYIWLLGSLLFLRFWLSVWRFVWLLFILYLDDWFSCGFGFVVFVFAFVFVVDCLFELIFGLIDGFDCLT